MNRRHFVKATGSLAVASSLLKPYPWLAAMESSPIGAPPRRVRLGGPIFLKSDDPEQLALEHRRLGYRAAYCPGVSLNNADRLKAIRAAFAKHEVVIAEVGRWVNLLDANPEKRKENLRLVTEGLALAEAVGALCCVDIAGSFNPSIWYGPHPKNFSPEFFDAVVENARQIIDAVKPAQARFCYEMMGWAMPDSPESYLKLIQAIDRPAFGVHLDPCNAINCPDRYYRNTELLNECFDKLGSYIVSCHAKDLTWEVEMNVHFREVQPGLGTLDYTTYLKRLAQLPQSPPLMMEHLASAVEYDAGRQHIFKVGRETGIEF